MVVIGDSDSDKLSDSASNTSSEYDDIISISTDSDDARDANNDTPAIHDPARVGQIPATIIYKQSHI